MTHVAIYFSNPRPDGPPFDHGGYREAYHGLARELLARGATCTFVRGKETFLGKGTFAGGWCFDEAGNLHEDRGPIRADVVYNKGEDFQADAETCLINHPALDALCRNKKRTLEQFPLFLPRAVLCESREELHMRLAHIPPATRVVAKPPDRWGGQGVIIDVPSRIMESACSFPILLQEFVDTSEGIHGLCSGTHDLRCFVISGTIALCSIRLPPARTFVANIAQGAAIILVPTEQVPDEPRRIVGEIDRSFEQYGTRIYSVDFGRSISGRFYVFELNSQPGLTAPHRGPGTLHLYEAVAQALITAC
ncbi:MAG: hypothetical protein AAB853_01145 [Patescibacteria group bacterium]